MLTILKVKITANKNYRNSALQKQMARCYLSLTVTLSSVKKRSHGKLYFIEHKKSFIKISVAEFYEHRKQRR